MASLKPQTVINAPSKFLKNEGVISVLSASVFGAAAIAFVSRFVAKNPILGRNLSFGLIAVGVLGFVFVAMKASGMIKAVLIGITSSVAIAGLSPFLTQLLPSSLRVGN